MTVLNPMFRPLSGSRRACAVLALGLACAGLPAASAAAAAPAAGEVFDPAAARPASLPAPALKGNVVLTPKLLLQLVAGHSAEVAYSRAQVEVAGELSKAEAALYEMVLFSSLRKDDTLRQRTVEERISSIATSKLDVLDERLQTAEVGLRERLPSGADISLSYRAREQRNNIIKSASPTDTQYDGALVLQLRQPLLRGFGKSVIETDLKVARAEEKIAALQYRQQLMKTGNDALALYWQLYRALEVSRIRQVALDYARRVEGDTLARIDAGKLAASNRIEARSAVLVREVEQIRAAQGVREVQSRLETMLNVPNLSEQITLSVPANAAEASRVESLSLAQRYADALARWPALGIARLRHEQAGIRLDYARNQSLPSLDLVLSNTRTGLSGSYGVARELTEGGHYPSWSIGVNLEVPLGGNGKARSQARAQDARVHQAELEVDSIRAALANDVRTRWEQARAGIDEVERMRADIELRTEMLRIERVRYDAGMGLLSQLLLRESELTESRQRLVDSLARMGQANDALLYADGSLLDHYAITLEH